MGVVALHQQDRRGQEGSVLEEPDPTLSAAMMGAKGKRTLPGMLGEESQGRGPALHRDTALPYWQEPGCL